MDRRVDRRHSTGAQESFDVPLVLYDCADEFCRFLLFVVVYLIRWMHDVARPGW
jgi:hypothetical protein